MNEPIVQQYMQLRNKVEGRIAQLQDRLSTKKKSFSCSSRLHMHQSHHNHHLHHHCAQNYPHCYHPQYSNRSYCNHSVMPVHCGNIKIPQNGSLQRIMEQNLHTQKQINGNLKALSERISDLSMRRSETNILDDQTRKITLFHQHSQADRYGGNSSFAARTKSLVGNVMGESNLSNNKRLRNSSISSKKNPKIKVTKVEKKRIQPPQNRQSQYFISDIKVRNSQCPSHSLKSIERNYSRRKNKQVYKDSAHRNRKHEKGHLMQTFKAQQKSRKQLLSKIGRNFFSDYGVK